MPLMKKCLCGNIAERHKDSNGKWFVYCENCSLAFGIDMKPCEMYMPGTGAAVFDTAEQARLAWDDWTDSFRKE